jgi:hypothetical protein
MARIVLLLCGLRQIARLVGNGDGFVKECVMTFRRIFGLAAMASALMTCHAWADLVNVTAFGGGVATIDFSNYESFTDQLNIGSQNYGVFTINSITVNGNNVFAPSPSAYLVGVFNGITVNSVSGTPPNINVGNDGGSFQIWQVSGSQIASAGAGLNIGNLFNQGGGGYAAAGCAVASLCYNGITNVGGTDYLNFDLVPGADAAGDSLLATLGTTNFPVTGSANGFGNITGGSAAGQFARGTYTTALGTSADLTFADEFCPAGSSGRCTPHVGDWQDLSFDPATVGVPEPVTLSLMGVGLFGLGVARRRRRQI